jgi:hypothetical protein
VRDVVAGDDKVLTALVPAAQHEMGVRVSGVEMIRRDPVEPRAKIALDLPHEIADERLQVVELGTVSAETMNRN